MSDAGASAATLTSGSAPVTVTQSAKPPTSRHDAEVKQQGTDMKHAGFNVVRMGDLSRDSFEPAQGKFKFEWFDNLMDKMQAAGIRVILDIPGACAHLAPSRLAGR